MTPFVNDVINLCADIALKFCEIYCYFFGHKWGEWAPWYQCHFGANRTCKRCGDMESDSQWVKRDSTLENKGG